MLRYSICDIHTCIADEVSEEMQGVKSLTAKEYIIIKYASTHKVRLTTSVINCNNVSKPKMKPHKCKYISR